MQQEIYSAEAASQKSFPTLPEPYLEREVIEKRPRRKNSSLLRLASKGRARTPLPDLPPPARLLDEEGKEPSAKIKKKGLSCMLCC